MVYDELDNELIGFAKESISFDIENAEPHERICFHRGTNYYYINNGLKNYTQFRESMKQKKYCRNKYGK